MFVTQHQRLKNVINSWQSRKPFGRGHFFPSGCVLLCSNTARIPCHGVRVVYKYRAAPTQAGLEAQHGSYPSWGLGKRTRLLWILTGELLPIRYGRRNPQSNPRAADLTLQQGCGMQGSHTISIFLTVIHSKQNSLVHCRSH